MSQEKLEQLALDCARTIISHEDFYGKCSNVFLGRLLLEFLQSATADLSAEVERLAAWKEFGTRVLNEVKSRVADCGWDENDDVLMSLAASLKLGNVRRVVYDPAKHGDLNEAIPGREIWFWGEEKA